MATPAFGSAPQSFGQFLGTTPHPNDLIDIINAFGQYYGPGGAAGAVPPVSAPTAPVASPAAPMSTPNPSPQPSVGSGKPVLSPINPSPPAPSGVANTGPATLSPTAPSGVANTGPATGVPVPSGQAASTAPVASGGAGVAPLPQLVQSSLNPLEFPGIWQAVVSAFMPGNAAALAAPNNASALAVLPQLGVGS